MKKDRQIFYCSVWFVLGFSVIFSFLGIILQSILPGIAGSIQSWLSKIAGAFIVFFGLYLVGLLSIPSLNKQYKFKVNTRSGYLTAFLFGAAFAVGWTPCVGPVLGAVLALAVTQPTSAFFLLVAYCLGLGIPFLIVGLFTQRSRQLIKKHSSLIMKLNKVFGWVLIALGTLIFTQRLDRVSSLPFLSNLVPSVASPSLHIGIAFAAGLISFLSPCVLPLIPGFLAYLASIVQKKK